jgi:hypothetical protein
MSPFTASHRASSASGRAPWRSGRARLTEIDHDAQYLRDHATPNGHVPEVPPQCDDENEAAEGLKLGPDERQLGASRIKLTLLFIPLPTNKAFFEGEERGESYLYYRRTILKPDGTRLRIQFADLMVTLTGHGLKTIRNRVHCHFQGVIQHEDEMHAQLERCAVTGMLVEAIKER